LVGPFKWLNLLSRNDERDVMSGTISSDDAQKLLEDRVKFKLYAAKQHLDRLKKYQTKPRKHYAFFRNKSKDRNGN